MHNVVPRYVHETLKMKTPFHSSSIIVIFLKRSNVMLLNMFLRWYVCCLDSTQPDQQTEKTKNSESLEVHAHYRYYLKLWSARNLGLYPHMAGSECSLVAYIANPIAPCCCCDNPQFAEFRPAMSNPNGLLSQNFGTASTRAAHWITY